MAKRKKEREKWKIRSNSAGNFIHFNATQKERKRKKKQNVANITLLTEAHLKACM